MCLFSNIAEMSLPMSNPLETTYENGDFCMSEGESIPDRLGEYSVKLATLKKSHYLLYE